MRLRRRGILLAWLAIAFLTAAPRSAAAQGADSLTAVQQDSLRRQFMLPLPPSLPVMLTSPRTSPGSSSGSPTAFGPNFGDGFVGGGFQARTRRNRRSFSEDADGSLVVGFGLGNSRDLIGVELALTSFSTWRSGLFSVAGASFKVHRVLPGNFGVAIGWENAVMLTEGGDGGSSIYGVVSRVWGQDWWNPFNNVTVSLGVGNGRFRFERDVQEGRERINAFGSIGLQVWEPVSVIADWTGQDLAAGLSLVPFVRIPLIITPGLADITGSAGDGARFILGAGMGFKFSQLSGLFP